MTMTMTRRGKKTPLLSVRDLGVRYATSGMFGMRRRITEAVGGISFDIPQGTTLGLVGESGSGKTSAALAIARLIPAQRGQVMLDGEDMTAARGEALRALRRKVQIIFQDPYSSLNPRLRAGDIVREPLDNLTQHDTATKRKIVRDLFAAVGLGDEHLRLFPHRFSGGQRQRIGIARALATSPQLVICDEPVSALDVAVQAQILNLLKRLQKTRGLTYLFISHDLGVIRHMCDEVAVMHGGAIVEHAPRRRLFQNPRHAHTRSLLGARPGLNTVKRD